MNLFILCPCQVQFIFFCTDSTSNFFSWATAPVSSDSVYLSQFSVGFKKSCWFTLFSSFLVKIGGKTAKLISCWRPVLPLIILKLVYLSFYCWIELFILDTKPLLVIWCFLQSVSCLFTLLIVSFEAQMLFILIKYSLSSLFLFVLLVLDLSIFG